MIYLSIFFTIAYLLAGLGFYFAISDVSKQLDMNFEEIANYQGYMLIFIWPLGLVFYLCEVLATIALKED